jgi:predicted nucleotidyltransferase
MNQKVEKIKKNLGANPIVEFAYLFGSQLRGTATKKSDWDIAVYFKKDLRSLSPWTTFILEAEIAREIEEEVQVTVLNNIDSPVFLFQIISEGLLLIERDSNNRILFEASVLRKYHDWQYFLKRQMAHKL